MRIFRVEKRPAACVPAESRAERIVAPPRPATPHRPRRRDLRTARQAIALSRQLLQETAAGQWGVAPDPAAHDPADKAESRLDIRRRFAAIKLGNRIALRNAESIVAQTRRLLARAAPPDS